MGASVSRSDFAWSYTDEPHATRRKLILAKYPQIKELMKVDPNFKWQVVCIVLFQFFSLYFISQIESYLGLFLCSYLLTGVLNHSLELAVHEIAHGEAFGQNSINKNRLFGMFANLPIGAPMSVSFKKYHLDHHRYQGDELLDTDIPCELEGKLFSTTATKLLWVILQPFFYIFRPFIVNPKPITRWELLNTVVQLSFDYLVYYCYGLKMVFYLLFSTAIVMGLHPCAGHFVAEHYILFKETGNDDIDPDNLVEGVSKSNGRILIPETCSYYGILNLLTFNVGYHVEHHDFPSIPGSRLPLVRKIAPEFYDNLEHHTSWTWVIFQYIIDPTVGPFARVKRKHQKNRLNSSNGLNSSNQHNLSNGQNGFKKSD